MQPGNHIHIPKIVKEWKNELTHSQVDSNFGGWNPNGLLDFQKAFWKVKIHWIENFILPLGSS
jgi:hypothetical protein